MQCAVWVRWWEEELELNEQEDNGQKKKTSQHSAGRNLNHQLVLSPYRISKSDKKNEYSIFNPFTITLITGYWVCKKKGGAPN